MKKASKIFWGLFFIVAAAFIIVGKLGYLAELSVFTLIFSAFLVAILIKSIIKVSYVGIFFPIAFLCILYDEYLGITALTPWAVLGAALLLTIGCSTLFGHKRWHIGPHVIHSDYTHEERTNSENNIRYEKSFGDSVNYVTSDDFEYADFDCSFASMKVYFDNAIIKRDIATIRVDCSFGGMELYIPRAWNVKINTEVAFGSVDEKNRNESTGSPVVNLIGDVSFGKVLIIYI